MNDVIKGALILGGCAVGLFLGVKAIDRVFERPSSLTLIINKGLKAELAKQENAS